jgi:hypothetical protein
MANIGLFFPNRCTPSVTVSGGSWLAALPAANVCDPMLAKVARSTDDATASTKIRLDLGAARTLRAFAIVNHNLSAAATWRVLLGTTSGASDVYAGTLAPWLAAGFEAGLVAAGMEDGEYLRDGTPAIIVLPAFYSARHITIEIEDTANPDGYVQIGRLFAGGGMVPEVNPEYGGMQDGWDDKSTKLESENGSEWATPRRRLKTVSFDLRSLSLAEGEQLHEMQRVLGTVDEVLYVPDVENAALAQRYGMLGTFSELSPLDYPYFNRRALPVRIRQKG